MHAYTRIRATLTQQNRKNLSNLACVSKDAFTPPEIVTHQADIVTRSLGQLVIRGMSSSAGVVHQNAMQVSCSATHPRIKTPGRAAFHSSWTSSRSTHASD
jgi:hypothetical protein